MADIIVRTQQLDRDELQKFIPVGNFRLIKAFENLMEDVAVTIPDAIGTTVTGPSITGDGDLALFDGTDGQKIKDSGVNIIDVALLNSPLFIGNPRAPTPVPGDNDTSIATTAFVSSAISGFGNVVGPASAVNNAIALYNGTTGKVIKDSAVLLTALAPLASPALTGTPTAPTPAPGTNSTQVATTAFVAASYAPLASPALTGTPTAPTAAAGTSTTQLATTAFVQGIAPGRLLNTQTLTASGTYTPTSGTTRVIVKGQGAGGAGGGSSITTAGQVSAGSGGGAGGIGETFLTSGFSGASVTIGAGGAPASGAAGGAGGSSSFGASLTLPGGAGGGIGTAAAATASFGGAGGTATGGSILNTSGARGESSCGAFAGVVVISGGGANSLYGAGGRGQPSGGGGGVGEAGAGFGSGGSGAVAVGAVGATAVGGAGTGGIFIVYEYS